MLEPGDDYDNLISWVISMNLDSVAEVMIPKISTEFLSRDLIDGITALSIAAENGNEKICRLLIQKGVPVDERTQESKFYKANEDIFTFKMPALASELEEISKTVTARPSKTTAVLSHSNLSRSNSISSQSSEESESSSDSSMAGAILNKSRVGKQGGGRDS